MNNYPLTPLYQQRFDYNKYNIKTAKRNLKKTSNGLGFFILAYYLVMIFTNIVLSVVISVLPNNPIDLNQTNSTPIYLIEIFVPVFAAFIPSLFYFLFSGNSISKTITLKHVKFNLLVPLVFIGLAVAMLSNYASDILAKNFSLFGLQNNINFDNSSSSLMQNILYIVTTAVVPAFAEEFAFRGVLMGTLRKYGDCFAIIASSVMFGTMHGNISQIPFAFILGLIFAYVDCKANSIVPSIIIHFLNNFYAVMIDILNKSEIIDSSMFYIIYCSLICLFCVAGLISFLILIKKDNKFFNITNSTGVTVNDAKLLSLKEKNSTFFKSAGVVASLILFLLSTLSYLSLI